MAWVREAGVSVYFISWTPKTVVGPVQAATLTQAPHGRRWCRGCHSEHSADRRVGLRALPPARQEPRRDQERGQEREQHADLGPQLHDAGAPPEHLDVAVERPCV